LARPALEAYQLCFDQMADRSFQAQRLKFITRPEGKQLVFILPGQAIYLAFNQLQDKGGYNMKADEIQALIALALVSSGSDAKLDPEAWEEKFFRSGTTPVDDTAYAAARGLYRKFDPENAAGLFNSDRRFGKFRDRIKMGDFNFTIDMPRG